jgi:hypothetical protein
MAKINGQRDELPEVETALRRQESAASAKVVVCDRNTKLVAFVVTNNVGTSGLPRLVRSQLAPRTAIQGQSRHGGPPQKFWIPDG